LAACRRVGATGEDTAEDAGEAPAEDAGEARAEDAGEATAAGAAAEDVGAAAGDTCPAGPLHIWPVHRRIRVLPPAPPTAQASLPEGAITPERMASDPGSGLGTRVQAVPFHRRISVLSLTPLPVHPTAQALSSDAAVTP